MPITTPVVISAAAEGVVDEAVVRSLLRHVGAMPGGIYGKNGKEHIRQKIRGYNNGARHNPWIVLVDLDHDAECAPPLRGSWLADLAPRMCFRIAVREVEAWLPADCERIASFLGVSRSGIPTDPETLDDPKATMVNLAQHSRRREIREDMVPRAGSARMIGPAYSSRLIEFVSTSPKPWRPDVACNLSESLRRSVACLKRLMQTQQSSRRGG